jgi:hypothetical protein
MCGSSRGLFTELIAELGAVGFARDRRVPMSEYNRARPGTVPTGTTPVIYEAAFRYTGGRPRSLGVAARRLRRRRLRVVPVEVAHELLHLRVREVLVRHRKVVIFQRERTIRQHVPYLKSSRGSPTLPGTLAFAAPYAR